MSSPGNTFGAAAVVETLLRRNEHFCRTSPKNDCDFEYCVIGLMERFRVTNGMNPTLKEIDHFIEQTDEKKMEPAHLHEVEPRSAFRSDALGYTIHEHHYSPGAEETPCGTCVFDFLERILNSWAEDITVDPKTSLLISLPNFIRRIKIAGERCAPSIAWTEIFNKAIFRYLNSGFLLPFDVEDLNWPVRDLECLVRNGPTENDGPIPMIKAKLDKLRSYHSNGTVADHSGDCLENWVRHYLSIPCCVNLSDEDYEYMLNELPSESSLRTSFCRQKCSDALALIRAPDCGIDPATEEAVEYLKASLRREQFCRTMTPVSKFDNCAKALVDMRKTNWATNWSPSRDALEGSLFWAFPFAGLDEELEKLKGRAPVLGSVQFGVAHAQKPMSGIEYDFATQWKEELGASICAGCFWEWAMSIERNHGYREGGTSPDKFSVDPRDLSELMRKYHSTCTSLGADWFGDPPYGDNPELWRAEQSNGDAWRYMKPRGIDSLQLDI